MTKEELSTMLLFINRMDMYIQPIDQSTITAFMHGLDIGRNYKLKWTDLVSDYLHETYRIERKAMGWTYQIKVFAKQNKIDWIEAFKVVMGEITKDQIKRV